MISQVVDAQSQTASRPSAARFFRNREGQIRCRSVSGVITDSFTDLPNEQRADFLHLTSGKEAAFVSAGHSG
jgi:hypothetical protein